MTHDAKKGLLIAVAEVRLLVAVTCGMRYRPFYLLLALSLGVGGRRLACAQPVTSIYNTISEPPHLPNTAGNQSFQELGETLAQNFRYPAGVQPQQVNGARHLEVVVTQVGKITTIDFDRSSDQAGIPPSVDDAIRTAIRQLPTLAPARYAGKPVAATLQISWWFVRGFFDNSTQMQVKISQLNNSIYELSGEGDMPPPKDPVPGETYTYVQQMPRLPTGEGLVAVTPAVQQALIVPANAQEGRVFVSFVVDEQGKLGELAIVQGRGAETDTAVLAAVRSLPLFEPGRQNNKPVRVRMTISVSVYVPKPAVPPSPGKRR